MKLPAGFHKGMAFPCPWSTSIDCQSVMNSFQTCYPSSILMIMTGWFLEASTVQEFIGAVLQWMSMGDALT